MDGIMGDDEKMKPENIAVAKLNEDMEKKLLQLSLDDIFGILHCKAKEIVPRGYDDV